MEINWAEVRRIIRIMVPYLNIPTVCSLAAHTEVCLLFLFQLYSPVMWEIKGYWEKLAVSNRSVDMAIHP
jgi:hypothetical protein